MNHLKQGMRFLFTVSCLLLTATVVNAHGGGIPQLANQPVGDYVISVWTDPEPLQVGTVHVTVGLAQDNAAVLNRAIQVSITPIERGETIRTLATHENSPNKFLYEADAELTRPGEYRFDIQIDDLTETVTFVDMVEGESWTSNPLFVGGLLVLVAAVAVAGWRKGVV